MVSYYHWLQEQRFDHPAVDRARALDFADFLTHPQTAASLRAAPYASYMHDVTGQERATASEVQPRHAAPEGPRRRAADGGEATTLQRDAVGGAEEPRVVRGVGGDRVDEGVGQDGVRRRIPGEAPLVHPGDQHPVEAAADELHGREHADRRVLQRAA